MLVMMILVMEMMELLVLGLNEENLSPFGYSYYLWVLDKK